jgi:ketosteroid isomerase-like protein
MIGAWIAKQKAPASLEALNRRDLDAWLKDWAEDATFIYPGDVRASGTYT